MYRQFIIAFIFCLSGAVVSPAFAVADFDTAKNLLLSIDENASGYDEKIDDFFRTLPGFQSNNQSFGASMIPEKFAPSLSGIFFLFNQNHKVEALHPPLFLLFHAFLFYDLH